MSIIISIPVLPSLNVFKNDLANEVDVIYTLDVIYIIQLFLYCKIIHDDLIN